MAKPVHKNDARAFIIGGIALAIIAVVAYLGVTVQGGGQLPLKSYTYVNAAFADVGTLKKGQDVTQAGVRVGTVHSISYSHGSAVVTMRLDGDKAIYNDAHASIGNQSALGRKEVLLDPGTARAGALSDGTIPRSHTSSSTSLDDVFAVFDPRTRTSLQSGLGELGAGLGGHGQDLNDALQSAPGLVDGLNKISSAAASREADLPALLQSADRVAGHLESRSSDLADLTRQVDETVKAIATDGGDPLKRSIQELPATLTSARSGLQSLDGPLADLRVAMTRVRPGAAALAKAVPSTRAFLRSAVAPLEKVPGVSRQALPAVDALTRTMDDARPLAPRIVGSLQDAAVLLAGLAPYSTDIGHFFSEHDLLSGELSPDKHYFSAMLSLPGLRNLSVPDPQAQVVPYPRPNGGAWADNPAEEGSR